jgi:uncharacterized protein YdbL (DUF1318 family)
LVIGATVAVALAGAKDLKKRMAARKPAINALKTSGIVGENNQGYLTLRKKQSDKKALVDAENADRRNVYQLIAKQQGTTAEHVGRRRALKIADIAAPGTWLQNAKGKWYKK